MMKNVILISLFCLLMIGCQFKVYSNPPGAQVIIDGNPTEYYTPCAIPISKIPIGHHSITVKAEGYKQPNPISIRRAIHVGRIVLTCFFPAPCVFIYPFTNQWTKVKPKEVHFSLVPETQPAVQP